MNPAQLATLADEITNDPLSLGYSGMSDPAVAASISAATRPSVKAVDTADIRRYVLINLLMPGIKDARIHGASAEIMEVADTVYETLEPGAFETIEINDSATYTSISAMMDVLVSAGIITGTDKTNILEMRDTFQTRAAELEIPSPTHLDVAYARGVR